MGSGVTLRVTPEATAEAAAADIGELAGEVRIIRWLASLLGAVLTGFGLLGAAVIQILVRLPWK